MDDVTFGRSGPYGDAWKASGVAILGRSLMSMNALLFYCALYEHSEKKQCTTLIWTTRAQS